MPDNDNQLNPEGDVQPDDVQTDDVQADAVGPVENTSKKKFRISWPRTTRSKRLLGGGVFFGIVIAVTVYWQSRTSEVTPEELLASALLLLDDSTNGNARREAVKIGNELQEIDFRDPKFPGGFEFILGLVAFRDAQEMNESSGEQRYLQASNLLRDAERRGLGPGRRPEWAFALGKSLQRIGLADEARPILRQAVGTYAPGKVEASMLLMEIYLDLMGAQVLEEALQLNTDLTKMKQEIDPEQMDQIYLLRAQILLALDRSMDAEKALAHLSNETSGNLGTRVFRARTLMAEKNYSEAFNLLREVAGDNGLERTFPRQASYLMGACAESIGNVDSAITYFGDTADKYEGTHEALAANLRAGNLLRQVGRNEEALEAFRRALENVKRPQDFRNRWITLEEFREAVRDAWEQWKNDHVYAEAIALANMLTPLLPTADARQMAAVANREWAKHLKSQLDQLPQSEQAERRKELIERWQQSGDAYANYAESLKTSSKYPTVLSISAEQYRKSHDFERALRQLTLFINTRPKKGIPEALVRRGEVLMDLDRLDEALEHFKQVVATYPTSLVAFKAQFLLGACHLERDELDLAEKTWRVMLASENLTPAATEWRLALFNLGSLLYHKAAILRIEAAEKQGTEAEDLDRQAFALLDESVRRLEEYLGRFGNVSQSVQTVEARYLLAKSLQKRADLPRMKLKTAETDNARLELGRTMKKLLDQAAKELRTLQIELQQQDQQGLLDELGKRFLRECYFEIAHTFYFLGKYDEAIVSYSAASNRYPKDPQILLAYIQMTNSYDRLGKPAEARSMLEQAKVILERMPAETFQEQHTTMSKIEWGSWIDTLRTLHRSGGVKGTAVP